MQYNFTVEHQIGNTGLRASYVRTVMRQGIYWYNINQPQPDNRPYNQKPRLFPQYADILNIQNGSFHDYNGFTAEVKRSFARGVMFQASWVWARDIGDLGWYYSMPENAYDRARERAPWLDIPTHRISGNVLYQLPFGKRRKFFTRRAGRRGRAGGGWELAVVAYYQTGHFLTPLRSGPDAAGMAYTDRDSPAFVTLRTDIFRN